MLMKTIAQRLFAMICISSLSVSLADFWQFL